jgi:hypothetical protein
VNPERAAHDSFDMSTTDVFTSILTDSLLKARGVPPRKELRTLRPDSVDTPPFDNSAFSDLVESSRTALDICHETTVYLETISEEPETLSPNHSGVNPVGHPSSLSGRDECGHITSHVPTKDNMTDSCSIRDHIAFFDSGTVSTTSTTPETDTSLAVPLGKTSRLPVLKRIRRISQGFSATSVRGVKIISPLIIQKKGKGRIYASSIPIITPHLQNRKLAST